jgi:hypothetical protein
MKTPKWMFILKIYIYTTAYAQNKKINLVRVIYLIADNTQFKTKNFTRAV